MIEREVFKRRTILFDKLETFGFIRENDVYVLERSLTEGMTCRVTISSAGDVIGKVYDAELGEEYVNHRNESATGAFVVGVRTAFENFLREIAEACSIPKLYVGDQTNRVNAHIASEFGVSPEFLWVKFPHFGVYRNPATRKWFAIIMNVAKGKVVPGSEGEAEVMNLKLDDRTEEYLGVGVYPSYHMNQKSWVSVLLDGTVSDDVIAEMLAVSFANSDKRAKRR